jgi:hypothetical protein
MSIDTPERVVFLNRIHLFNGLNDDQFTAVAEVLTEETHPAGNEIITQGTQGDCLYLIWSGKVSVTRAGIEKPLATFVDGDYFGEESMLASRHLRTATVTAIEETQLLVLTCEHFVELLKQAPGLKTNFAVTINSHHLERRLRFNWLQPDEVIYFLARKHPIMLVPALTGPVLLGLAAVIGMLASWYYSLWFPGLAILWYVCLVVGLGAAGWGGWNGIDWGNDYYIVTDRRVVWVEKVIGIYESRQEAPLSAVQRVNVEKDLSGQVLDYGDLAIQTIVGSTLTLRNVSHPSQAAALIDQHWKRSKETSHKIQKEEMENALRTRLLGGEDKPAEIKGVVAPLKEKEDPYKNQRGLVNLFRLRFEHMTTVTYRKHIFVLLEQTWMPGVVFLILLATLAYAVFNPSDAFKTIFNAQAGLLSFFWVILFIAALLWWIYEYIDWRNDIFQVTPDQIKDIDKTPLGQITTDIASLDNILSIEYRRIGILELLFNYGTVYITVGGGKEMAFENVFNPSAVQDDIERRRLEKITKKEQETIKAERERVVNWFAAYYNNEQKHWEKGIAGDQTQDDNRPQNEVK